MSVLFIEKEFFCLLKTYFSWGEGQWDAQVRTGLQLGKLRLSCPVTGLKAIKEQTNVRPGKGPRL